MNFSGAHLFPWSSDTLVGIPEEVQGMSLNLKYADSLLRAENTVPLRHLSKGDSVGMRITGRGKVWVKTYPKTGESQGEMYQRDQVISGKIGSRG